MIRFLTLTLFVATPVASVAGWILGGPAIAGAIVVVLPVIAVGATVLTLRRSPERASRELASRRDDLKAHLDA
jgi:hypothetical protein